MADEPTFKSTGVRINGNVFPWRFVVPFSTVILGLCFNAGVTWQQLHTLQQKVDSRDTQKERVSVLEAQVDWLMRQQYPRP